MDEPQTLVRQEGHLQDLPGGCGQYSAYMFSPFSSPFSSSSAFPAISLEFTFFGGAGGGGDGFLFISPLFNPTIEIVTFCLHGWCMVGVIYFTGILGHECQDLLCLCDGTYVCTD